MTVEHVRKGVVGLLLEEEEEGDAHFERWLASRKGELTPDGKGEPSPELWKWKKVRKVRRTVGLN